MMVKPLASPRHHRFTAVVATALALAAVLAVATPAALDAAAPAGGTRTISAPPQLQVDRSKVDLANHRLELRLSRPPARVQLRVLAATGEVLADEEQDLSGQAAGSPLTVTWTPRSAAPPARIEIRATDTTGGFDSVALFWWSLSIPHEEVVFPTDSAEITPSERPKLEDSLKKISAALARHKDEFGRPTLFIYAHTDTVGAAGHNIKLSQARAQAIARWFRGRGLRIPVAYEGFGEHDLAVKTADETDEPRNRRADYILSIEEPVLKSSSAFRASWKRLK